MRIKRLHVPSFGPFTDYEIDLAKGESDFHIIHGPNEAGKSSLLRAIRGLFFGIPERTADNFLHENSRLRIAADLEHLDGSSRYVQRRKGRKDTLLDVDNKALSDGELARYLGVVDEAYFDSMFGMDGASLRAGANELLRGEGKLGEALFSASLGGTPVERVLKGLQDEASDLFSGRARKLIRVGCGAILDHRKKAKEALLKPDEVEQVEREMGRLMKELRELREERSKKTSRKAWLERCRGALPTVGQLDQLRRRLEEMPDMPALPAAFPTEIREARDAWKRADEQEKFLLARIELQEARQSQCELNPEVLARQAEIEAIQSGVGAYRQDREDHANKAIEADQLKARIAVRCVELEISGSTEKLDPYRVTEPGFLAARQAADAHVATVADLQAARERLRVLEGEIEELKGRATSSTDEARLQALEAALRPASPLEARAVGLEARRTKVTELQQKLKSLHRKLSGVPNDFEQVCQLAIPLKSTIDQFRDDDGEARRQRVRLEADQVAKRAEIGKLSGEMERLVRQRDVPTLADLHQARVERDDTWKSVADAWRSNPPKSGSHAGEFLEKAYPGTVVRADEIADRLRLEAETVAQFEEKRLQHEQAERELKAIDEALALAQSSEAALAERWKNTWSGCGFVPMSPKEMSEWRGHWEEFERTWTEWSTSAASVTKDEEEIQAGAANLAEVLGSDESDFLSMLNLARAQVAQFTKAAGAVEESARLLDAKEKLHGRVKSEVAGLEEAESGALARWKTVATERNLPASLAPSNAVELLIARRELIRDHDRWLELKRDRATLLQRAEEFEARVGALAKTLALPSADAEVAESILRQALQKALAQQQRRDGLEEETENAKIERAEVARAVVSARAEFDAQLKKCAVTNDADLDGFLAGLEDRQSCQVKADDLRQVLAGIALGQTVEEFVAMVMAEDAGSLEAELVSLEEELSEMDERFEIVRGDLQREEGKRDEFERANDEAARQAQLADHVAAQVTRDAERFVRLQLAISILRSRIDRFREQNQGPFLERASVWFREITGGTFSGMTTAYDASDNPVIAGVRTGDSSAHGVTVEGMSEGTRDQLFLALRLAGLELHRKEYEPVPMVLDDLLVHFDDRRSANALSALSQLGRGSQVLLFTHHTHLVELARQTLGVSGFHLTELISLR